MASRKASTGLLISFDGLDSSGKQTQSQLLVDRLRAASRQVHTFCTPDYTTPTGLELRARLQGKLGDWSATPWEDKLRFFANNRAEHREEVTAALAAGDIVVYDRYIPSSLAFITVEAQLQKPSLSRQEIHRAVHRVEYEEQHMPQGDYSIFLDVPPQRALGLLAGRKQTQQEEDEYTDQLAVQEKLYHEYEYLLNTTPDRSVRIPCIEAEALRPPELIAQHIWQELTQRFPTLTGR